MSSVSFGDSKINSLANLNDAKLVPNSMNKEKETISTLQLFEKVEISNTEKGNVPANLDLKSSKTDALPEIKIMTDGNISFYTNAYGQKITVLKTEGGISYNTLSDQGLAIILKNNFEKRDVLVFSAMTDKVKKNSNIHDNYFYVNAENRNKYDSKIYFDQKHNIVIDINDNNKLILDGKDAQTVLDGPFKINFNPDSDGRDFNVNYTGPDKLKRLNSFGGNIKF